VLRYLLKNKLPNVKSLSLISAPFDVKHAIDNMHPWYQSFFIKSYIENSVCKHEKMKFWWENNIVNLEHLKESRNLRDFHERITTKVTGEDDLDKFFDHFKIQCQDL
jgi:predicted alpha/beta-fold hydrolase